MAAAQYEGLPIGVDPTVALIHSRLEAQDRASAAWRHEVRGDMETTRELVKQVDERVARLEVAHRVNEALEHERARVAKADAADAAERDEDARAAAGRQVTMRSTRWTVVATIIAAVMSGIAGDVLLAWSGIIR